MQTGIYQHFKGGLYIVMGVGKHSETEEELVIYRDESGRYWVRPIAMFQEDVDKDGYKGPRFKLLAEMQFGKVDIKSILERGSKKA